MGVFTTELPVDAEIRYVPGEKGAWSYTVVTPAKDGYEIQFSTADGSLTYIGSDGNKSQTLRLSNYRTEGNQFSDIEIDFSTLKNLSNGGSSTGAMSPGNAGEGEGKRVGAMIGLSVDQSGMIYGSYSNGNTTLLGQIAVARFANASGLESIGENCYRTTMNSGQFDGIGVEMDSDGSTIDSGTLEMSNVDLATEFTMMITTQRGYQANSRVISTSDSILEELVNLKRFDAYIDNGNTTAGRRAVKAIENARRKTSRCILWAGAAFCRLSQWGSCARRRLPTKYSGIPTAGKLQSAISLRRTAT